MKITGFPTLLMTRRLQTFVGETRSELDSARVEAVTGFAVDRAEKVGGDIGRVRKLEKLLADNDQRVTAISQFRADAAVVQLSLTQSREALSDLQFDLKSALSLKNEAGVDAAARGAQTELESLWSRLNATHAGRYLFSGAATDTPPLGDLDTLLADVRANLGATAAATETNLDAYFDDPAGVFQTTIYQGSTKDAPDREVDQNRRLGIQVKAVDPEIRDAIRSLAVIAVSGDIYDTEVRDETLQANADRAGEASNAIIGVQTLLGAREEDAALLESRHNAAGDVLQQQLLDLLSVDQFEAANRMNELETQLEAAFLTTARIQQLSLVNFLR